MNDTGYWFEEGIITLKGKYTTSIHTHVMNRDGLHVPSFLKHTFVSGDSPKNWLLT
jgi:hypothetical protein